MSMIGNTWPKRIPFLVPDDVRLCNCAGCNREIVGMASKTWQARLSEIKQAQAPLVAARIKDRPYCEECLGGMDAAKVLEAMYAEVVLAEGASQ